MVSVLPVGDDDLVALDAVHRHLYSEEAPCYDKNRFASKRGRLYSYFELRAIVRLLQPLEGRRILDVAGGTARVALSLAAHGANVAVVDVTWEMLNVGRCRVEDLGLHNLFFTTGNGRQLPFLDGTFDIVMCVRFLHLLPPTTWSCFIAEMRRVVKPDGLVLVQLFNPLYGGPLAMLRQGLRWIRRQPREQFVWLHRIRDVFAGFDIVSITSFWLPGMGLLGSEDSALFDRLSRACTRPPLSWISGPHHVLARPSG